ncbi:MAG: ABC transporter ATP-binding protein [Planctomycetaceae bacterium]
MLQLESVSKTYVDSQTQVRAVDDVSLQIQAGEFVAVRGPSGCGKSTLLLMAGGLLKPDSGTVIVDGQKPYDLTADVRAEFRARTIGFVFQQFHLVPYLTVRENILAAGMAVTRSATETSEQADQLIARFSLTDRRHHVPAKLSSGERQRTALARALLNRPKLLLADEPTGNLDHDSADTVLGCLKQFAADGGAVLLVTHDDRAAAWADSTVRLEHGKRIDSESFDDDRPFIPHD